MGVFFGTWRWEEEEVPQYFLYEGKWFWWWAGRRTLGLGGGASFFVSFVLALLFWRRFGRACGTAMRRTQSWWMKGGGFLTIYAAGGGKTSRGSIGRSGLGVGLGVANQSEISLCAGHL